MPFISFRFIVHDILILFYREKAFKNKHYTIKLRRSDLFVE